MFLTGINLKKMTYMKESDLRHLIRVHSYSVSVNQSRELTPEEREVYKKILQQQLENNKENIYQSLDLCTAYHLLKKNRNTLNPYYN